MRHAGNDLAPFVPFPSIITLPKTLHCSNRDRLHSSNNDSPSFVQTTLWHSICTVWQKHGYICVDIITDRVDSKVYSENARVCVKWQWNARDCITRLHDRRSREYNPHSPHRISAIGWLLFMKCVSFTSTGLFLRWTPAKIFEAPLAKLLSGCDSVTCLTKCKARHWKYCDMLKKTCHFQTDWMLCVLYQGICNHVVSYAGSTCFRCWFLVANNINRSCHSPTKIAPKLKQWKVLCVWKYTYERSELSLPG